MPQWLIDLIEKAVTDAIHGVLVNNGVAPDHLPTKPAPRPPFLQR